MIPKADTVDIYITIKERTIMSLRRFEISLDEERITKDGVYTSEELYYTLDSAMKRKNILKTGKGIYDGDDIHAFGAMYFSLYGCMWFMKYVDKLIKADNNKGIILRLDTPGGSVYEADELYLKLME